MGRLRHLRVALASVLLAGLAEPRLQGLLPAPPSEPGPAVLEPAYQPTWRGTEGLRQLYGELREVVLRGRWPRLGEGPTLRLGDRGGAVTALRARLLVNGDAPPTPPLDPLLFDRALDRAIRAFQARVGLEPDGVVGRATRIELDRSPRERMLQIARTIASRRALPAELGERFLLLNLPAFELEAYEAGRVALRSRVVVGAADRPTPQLWSEIRTVVVHPRWHVPGRIARHEIAARAAADPDYLDRLGFEILPAAGDERLTAGEVDWDGFARGELDLRLRQRPGPGNALGSVNLRFPNRYHLSLHDTPERRAFARARRDESHGCIRVERALEVARWVLRGEPGGAELDRLHGSGATAALALARPVPIYLVDWPVWIDAAGAPQIRAELYPGRRRGPPRTQLAEEAAPAVTPVAALVDGPGVESGVR